MSRITKKLLEAADVLCREEYGDCRPDEVWAEITRRNVPVASVYRLLARLGYRWTGRTWMRTRLPVWLREVRRHESDEVF